MTTNLTELIGQYGTDQLTVTDVSIYFDGGDSGQWAYGSWEALGEGFTKKVHRKSFAGYKETEFVTSNVAEYCALIDALEWLQSLDKENYKLSIFGDSMLVVSQVNGTFKCRKPHLGRLRDRVLELLEGFDDWKISWYRRIHNVQRFGH